MVNKTGKIVSRKASKASKKSFDKKGLSAFSYRSSYTPDWLSNIEAEEHHH
jgi:hypothetical protein